jgi:hypothetical protein
VAPLTLNVKSLADGSTVMEDLDSDGHVDQTDVIELKEGEAGPSKDE